MSTNKHATIRYHALDQCFSNPYRKFFIENLIDTCNQFLEEYTGTSQGVGRRQIFEDIKFMESEQGWAIPLEKIKEGRKVYYRYSDKNFSIKKQVINTQEASQLKETLSILNRFSGLPQFEWMEELLIRLESSFYIKNNNKPFVSFEQNPYLKGLNYFTELFNAIQYRRVLEITYQGFKQLEPITMNLHPYYLKQFNNRWFLFAHNEQTNTISNLALDRILNIQEKNTQYIENKTINFDEYFEDVVGVTVIEKQKPVKILLNIDNELIPYIESKPIHGSQKIKERNVNSVIIELYIQLNYEFISLLFSYGEAITVIEPVNLKNIIKKKAEKLINNYI